MPASSYRQRRICIALELFVDIFKKNENPFFVTVTKNPLPDDTKFIRCYTLTDITTDPVVWIVVESKKFDEVAEGDPIPEHPAVEFTTIYKE